jgi:hypothetical protein
MKNTISGSSRKLWVACLIVLLAIAVAALVGLLTGWPWREEPTTLEKAEAMKLSGQYGHILIMPTESADQFKGVLEIEQDGTNLSGIHLLVFLTSKTNEQSLVARVAGTISDRGEIRLVGTYRLTSLVGTYSKSMAELETWLADPDLDSELRERCLDQRGRLERAWNTPFFVIEYDLSRIDDGDLAGSFQYPTDPNSDSTLYKALTEESDEIPDMFDVAMPILLRCLSSRSAE